MTSRDPIIVAHRGIWSGHDPIYDSSSLLRKMEFFSSIGVHAEIDISFSENCTPLIGHDTFDQFPTDFNQLEIFKESLLLHIKSCTPQAIKYLTQHSYNFFFHTNEECVYTSKAWLLCHSSYCLKYLGSEHVGLVMPEYTIDQHTIATHALSNPVILTDCGKLTFSAWSSSTPSA